ncbi:MAG: PTS beta-glucoside transporter subunit EIIBCA [Microbacterium sp. 71-36]|uniref:beta-glucoside-specific PTS transporter subunit IIABC n=1 Tax=unclassified Microbacterium TaxID=2609290 RepID=UPI0008684AEC|nr:MULTISPECIES: beta-glucoside-specific PTS transporter subunit IIABC [unclassified Microbacterium]MBN9211740.1 PTS glucose transporter subunit IIA [Microbacterium sp.]ODT37417.1 MAG: PTS beta-glucoside transporter subunit EIIBCA [Microbacterium sp. SCN 71-17]ODU51720.1 MAG: PTS beta-glucoside transporter subunit EIIBCA [Microbacterium sp. SCN 70-10]OJV78216.1 MAG: PTS beta-glucoside transporter subunit EIIBCA [Microbacterium sp. 71-36]
MADHAKTAAGVLAGVGGESNVQSLVHCATRLRFVLKDESKADAAAIRAVPGVITTAQAGGQYQVVIGNDVPDVYAAIQSQTKVGGDAGAEEGPKGNLFNRFIKMISAIFTPILWALAGTGLLKAFLAAAVTFGWMDATTTTYTILNALSDALINFLPLALAITAARYFKASEFTSFAIAGALVYPSITALTGAPDVTFFGIPVTMVSYVSSVIPVIIIVWLQSHAERFLLKVLPGAVRRFVTPMIVVLVAVPLVFVVIGPLSALLGGGLASGIGWVFETVPWLGGAIMGGLWQVFVIFGLHWGLVPLFQLEYQTTGMILLIGPVFAAVLAQAAAVAGVLVRSRNKNLRSLAAPATLSGFLAGITEPAIYGINLPLKRPFAFGVVGGALGGALIAMGGVFSKAFVVPSGLALPALLGNGNMVMLAIGLAVAVVVPFLLTVLIGFKDPVDEAAPAAPAAATDTVVLNPVDGSVVALSEVPDAAFADGSLGKGVAVRPTSGAVYAPFDATVVAAFPTGHAVGLRGVDGVELLIHVGLDTVKLGGEHFSLKVSSGQQVKAGDLLVEFDGDAIERAGYDLITPVIVTNGDLYPDVADVASGPLSHGETLFRAVSVDSLSATR